MHHNIEILIAEDDDGHALLIKKNLKRAGVMNKTIRFKDGQETLDFLFKNKKDLTPNSNVSYVLLLDINMPKKNGVDVLRQIKKDEKLQKLPIIMLTTTDNPVEIDECYRLGCNNYIAKPVDYDKFIETIKKLGLFLMIVKTPQI